MIFYKADKIGFMYENQAEYLFKNLYFVVDSNSKIGLIGRNGSGKSTLLNLLVGSLKIYEGNLYRAKEINSGFVRQEFPKSMMDKTVFEYLASAKNILIRLKNIIDNSEKYSNSEVIEALAKYQDLNGFEFERRVVATIERLGFDNSFLNRKLATLSGGEKSKLAFCNIILDNPDILLLDEPTNHLDIKNIKYIEEFLLSLKIPFIIVSHDRKFLDNTVNEIWELRKGRLNIFKGNYSTYKKEIEKEKQSKLAAYKESQKKIKQLKRVYNQRRQWALSYQNQTGKEGYAPVFEMVTNPAKSAMKRAKSIETRLKREIDKEESKKPWIEKERKINFSENTLKSKTVLKVENISKSYADKSVIKNVNFTLFNGERLLIQGKNGSGKTTLLKILAGIIKDFKGKYVWNPQVKIGYYSQEFENLDFNKTIIDEVTGGNLKKQTAARTILGSLNISGDNVFKKIKDLSIGERSKTALAKLLVSNANVYLLDEPNNHLEIEAREALEKALSEYNGSMIFVSHDRYFNELLADRKVDIESFD